MRISSGVMLLSLMTATAVAQQTDKPVAQNTAPSQFQKNPALPDCLTLAVERGDPSSGPSILLVKGTKGCSAPWHFHSPNEQLMMVSGTGRVEMKGEAAVNLHSGGFAFAPVKHVHPPASADRVRSSCIRMDRSIFIMWIKTALRFQPTRRCTDSARRARGGSLPKQQDAAGVPARRYGFLSSTAACSCRSTSSSRRSSSP